jgi:hypothetical protein
MTGLIGRVAVGQILPLGARPQDPQDAIEHLPRLAPGAPAAIGPPWRFRDNRLEYSPLFISQVHGDTLCSSLFGVSYRYSAENNKCSTALCHARLQRDLVSQTL